MLSRRLSPFVLLLLPSLFAANPEFDFYPEVRGFLRENRALGLDGVLQRYAASLRTKGVADSEIERRLALIRNSRPALEDDFWNRFFTEGKANYNKAPNAF